MDMEGSTNSRTLLKRRKRNIKISKNEIILMLRSYIEHPTNWTYILDSIKENIDQLPHDAKNLYRSSSLKQLRERLSGKLGKFMAATRIEDEEIREAVQIIKDQETRLVSRSRHNAEENEQEVLDDRDRIAGNITDTSGDDSEDDDLPSLPPQPNAPIRPQLISRPTKLDTNKTARPAQLEKIHRVVPNQLDTTQRGRPAQLHSEDEITQRGRQAQPDYIQRGRPAQAKVTQNGCPAQTETIQRARQAQPDTIREGRFEQLETAQRDRQAQSQTTQRGRPAQPDTIDRVRPAQIQNTHRDRPAQFENNQRGRPEQVERNQAGRPSLSDKSTRNRRRPLADLIRKNQMLYNDFLRNKIPRLLRHIGVDSDSD